MNVEIFYDIFMSSFYFYIIYKYIRIFDTENTKPVASKPIEYLCYGFFSRHLCYQWSS